MYSRRGLGLESDEVAVAPAALQGFLAEAYGRVGIGNEDASSIAHFQVEADLRGVWSHGSRLMPSYVREVKSGDLNPVPVTREIRDNLAAAVLDGDGGLGHPACARAMELAIEKAERFGAGSVGVVNSGHAGAIGTFTQLAARKGMIGFGVTSTGVPTVLAPDGVLPATPNNAISFAIPSARGSAIVLDSSCAEAAWGRVDVMEMYGLRVPQEWFPLGTSSSCEHSSRPPMAPRGGALGYGLAVVASLLAGPLLGGLLPQEKVRDSADHFLLALSVDHFVERERFMDDVDRWVDHLKETSSPDGASVLFPGELEEERYSEWTRSGIPLHVVHLEQLSEVAIDLGIGVPW